MKRTCGNSKKRMIPGTFTSVALVLVMVLVFSITAFAAGEEAAEETTDAVMMTGAKAKAAAADKLTKTFLI